MLDIQIFRDNPASIRADFSKRGIDDALIDEVVRLDETWRQIRYEVDQLRKKKNSAAIGVLVRGMNTSPELLSAPDRLKATAPI